MMLRLVLIVLLVLPIVVVVPNCVNADVTITYGRVDMGTGTVYIDLQAETAGQAVQFFATGIVADGGSDGFELDAQIGDGGELHGGSDTSPVISSVDLILETIWDNSPTQQNVIQDPLLIQSNLETTSLVSANGLIGTIFFDTTGFGTGEIDFLLTGVGGVLNTTVTQGALPLTTIAPNAVIRVVPEPAGALLVVASMVGLGLRRRRFTG